MTPPLASRQLETLLYPLSDLKPFDRNPKKHSPEQIKRLQASIKAFGWTRPVTATIDGTIVAGHGASLAAKEAGYTHIPVLFVAFTDNQTKSYVVADNRLAELGEDDPSLLAGLLEEVSALPDIDIEAVGYNQDELDYALEELEGLQEGGSGAGGSGAYEVENGGDGEGSSGRQQNGDPDPGTGDPDLNTGLPPVDPGPKKEEAKRALTDRFIVPPFSILDTRQGYWQARKKHWNALIGDGGESREDALGFESICRSDNYTGHSTTRTVSLLDAVVAELSNLWFNVPGGKSFDTFSGDSVFGFVSGYMGHEFTGIEIRPEQASINQERCRAAGLPCTYINDDGQNVLKHLKPGSMDLFFSCPPYYDLEKYSDLTNDASNQGTYEDFLKILDNAFTGAVKCLKDNRFAVIVVGDIRDDKGLYRRFPDDIKDVFEREGCKLYNRMIIVNCAGTAPIRAAHQMKNRKVVTTHQEVLVFYKGDPARIQRHFPEIDFSQVAGAEDVGPEDGAQDPGEDESPEVEDGV